MRREAMEAARHVSTSAQSCPPTCIRTAVIVQRHKACLCAVERGHLRSVKGREAWKQGGEVRSQEATSSKLLKTLLAMIYMNWARLNQH